MSLGERVSKCPQWLSTKWAWQQEKQMLVLELAYFDFTRWRKKFIKSGCKVHGLLVPSL